MKTFFYGAYIPQFRWGALSAETPQGDVNRTSEVIYANLVGGLGESLATPGESVRIYGIIYMVWTAHLEALAYMSTP